MVTRQFNPLTRRSGMMAPARPTATGVMFHRSMVRLRNVKDGASLHLLSGREIHGPRRLHAPKAGDLTSDYRLRIRVGTTAATTTSPVSRDGCTTTIPSAAPTGSARHFELELLWQRRPRGLVQYGLLRRVGPTDPLHDRLGRSRLHGQQGRQPSRQREQTVLRDASRPIPRVRTSGRT